MLMVGFLQLSENLQMKYRKLILNLKAFSFLVSILLCVNFSEGQPSKNIFIVKNSLKVDRSFETVEIDLKDVNNQGINLKMEKFTIIDIAAEKEIISQVVDNDGDGNFDQILFQPEIKANSKRAYKVVIQSVQPNEEDNIRCYSRFVPERTDDYAWENNRVAFRTYGPTAQKMVEENIAGGTLSSGIDAWLKRVEYPIINKWYKKTTTGKGSYHEDTGEGLDNFHVGASRGVGGIAVKVDSSYYTSKNFKTWKTITNGPIRTSFVLEYEDWDANGNLISEIKTISLDYGGNLSKISIELKGINTITAGLTLHKKDGEVTTNLKKGWLSYWEPFADSQLGQGLVAPKESLIGFQNYNTNKIDESNLYAHLKVKKNKVVYYAGFAWKKSGQFNSKAAWNAYLNDFSNKINNPLQVIKL